MQTEQIKQALEEKLGTLVDIVHHKQLGVIYKVQATELLSRLYMSVDEDTSAPVAPASAPAAAKQTKPIAEPKPVRKRKGGKFTK